MLISSDVIFRLGPCEQSLDPRSVVRPLLIRMRAAVTLGITIALATAVYFALQRSMAVVADFGIAFADALHRVHANSISAPRGSVILVGTDTVGEIFRVTGLRRNSAQADSFMAFHGRLNFRPAADRLRRDSGYVALLQPVRSWNAPVLIRIVKDSAIGVASHDRLILDSSGRYAAIRYLHAAP